MTANDWTPPADDVEAAAQAVRIQFGQREASPEDVTNMVIAALHTRGWRDGSEASSLLKRNADLIAERDQANARALEAETRRGTAESDLRWANQCHERELEDARAKRDALAERCREYEREFGDVDGLRAYVRKYESQRDRAEARAAKMEAALREIAEHDHYTMAGLPVAESMQMIARAALTPTADTDGSKT